MSGESTLPIGTGGQLSHLGQWVMTQLLRSFCGKDKGPVKGQERVVRRSIPMLRVLMKTRRVQRVEQTNGTSRQTGRIALAVDKIHTVPRNGSRSTGKSSERGASRESLLSYDCSRRCLHSSKRNKRMLVSGVVERTTLHSCRIIEDADSISFVSIMKQIE